MFDENYQYKDRLEAGNILGLKLMEKVSNNTVVIGIPRGGVVVAARVAEMLNNPLDIIIPRKIGAPFNPEVAIGAVTQDGTVLLNSHVMATYNIEEKEIETLIQEQVAEIKRRMVKYRGSADYPDYSGKLIILVDDGIATGFTARAAVQSLKNMFRPRRIILAAPVMPADTITRLSGYVDEIVCPLTAEKFYAVGQFYKEFEQTTDAEVINLLHKIKKARKDNTGGVNMKKIALDDDLQRFRKDLEREGFTVVDGAMADDADAYIVSGMENNFMNMQDRATEKKVIDASGKDINEVINELRITP